MITLSVMQFETATECKAMAQKFLLYVVDIFDNLGYELNESIVFPKGKTLHIDRAYLSHWLDFESKGYNARITTCDVRAYFGGFKLHDIRVHEVR